MEGRRPGLPGRVRSAIRSRDVDGRPVGGLPRGPPRRTAVGSEPAATRSRSDLLGLESMTIPPTRKRPRRVELSRAPTQTGARMSANGTNPPASPPLFPFFTDLSRDDDPRLAQLRVEAPVAKVRIAGRHDVWVATRQ